MRIVFTAPNFAAPFMGRAYALQKVAHHLAAYGHEIHVVTLAPQQSLGAFGYDVVGRTAQGAPVGPVLREHLQRWAPDVVVCHELRNPLTREALRWALRSNVRAAVQPHGQLRVGRWAPHALSRARFAAYDRFSTRELHDPRVTFIAKSLAEEREIAAVHGTQRVARLYPGTELTAQPRTLAIRDPPKALMLANFGTLRDPRWVLDAARRVQASGRKVDLTLAGPWQEQRWFGDAMPANVFTGAQYLGAVPREKRRGVYQEADLFIYASRHESFGLPILEAAATGLPVVAPPVGLAAELGFEDGAGALASGPEPEHMARALRDLLPRLDDAQGQARLHGTALRAWADWNHRAEAHRTWLEGGQVVPDPPPRPGTW